MCKEARGNGKKHTTRLNSKGRSLCTSVQREEDMLDEGEEPVVLDVARLAEGLLQLLLHVLLLVQQVDLGVLWSAVERY